MSGCARLNTIHNLIRLGRNDKLKERAIRQESINFGKVKNYIISGKIQKGLSQKTSVRKFGQPTVILYRPEGQRWIYKPGQADWIGSEKIYLFFKNDGRLVNWDCVNLDCVPH